MPQDPGRKGFDMTDQGDLGVYLAALTGKVFAEDQRERAHVSRAAA